MKRGSFKQILGDIAYGQIFPCIYYPLSRLTTKPHEAWYRNPPGHFYSPIPSQEDVINGKRTLILPESQKYSTNTPWDPFKRRRAGAQSEQYSSILS
jgi:hypothetical protein